MIDPADMTHCEEAIRHGSLSFHAASRLLPTHVRDPALALYAFCRLADDAVDLNEEKPAAVLSLRDRLDLCYEGRPRNTPADRAFATMIEEHQMPRELPEALLEGFAWDAMGRQYRTLSDLQAYAARVAAAVGAMMTVLMGVRDADALARACDLGVAMQLTNIARDVGEDAQAGRIYLPLDWLDEAGIDPKAFLTNPRPLPGLTRRLLLAAERLYFRAEAGVPRLPAGCRPGIYAARHIYAAIGTDVARAGFDSVTRRARTTTTQKLALLALAYAKSGTSMVLPAPATLYADPLPECAFLVEAAARGQPARGTWGEGRAGTLVAALAALEARDRERGALMAGGRRTT